MVEMGALFDADIVQISCNRQLGIYLQQRTACLSEEVQKLSPR
jgi:hypothetical protein